MSREIARGEGPHMAKIRQVLASGSGQHIKYAVHNCSFSFNDYSSNSEALLLAIFGGVKKRG
jgi:hypothetical protein